MPDYVVGYFAGWEDPTIGNCKWHLTRCGFSRRRLGYSLVYRHVKIDCDKSGFTLFVDGKKEGCRQTWDEMLQLMKLLRYLLPFRWDHVDKVPYLV